MITSLVVALAAVFLLPACSQEAKRERIAERAGDFYDSGDLESARIEYLNLLREDPASVQANRFLGLIWFRQGALLEALPYLQRTASVAPGDAEIRRALANALGALGARDQARAEADALVEAAPESGEAWFTLAELSQTPEQIAETVERLGAAPPAAVETAEFEVAQAVLAARSGDRSAARSHVDEALARDPNLAIAHLASANLHLDAGEFDAAEQAFRKVAELAEPRSPIQLRHAVFLRSREMADAAIEELEAITGATPDALHAWRLLAQLRFEKGQYEAARDAADQVLRVAPKDFEAAFLTARSHAVGGDRDTAREWYARLAEAFPKNPLVHFEIARLRVAGGDYDGARESLNRTLELHREHTGAAFLLARLEMQAGNPQEAVTVLEPLVERQPALYEAQDLLADAYRRLGRLSAAEELIRKRLEQSPGNLALVLVFADTLARQEKVAEARRVLEAGRAQAPETPAFDMALANLDILEKKNDDAIARLEERLESNPESAEAHVALGMIHLSEKRWAAAEEHLEKAAELKPDQLTAVDRLIDVYRATNRLPEARAKVEAFLEKNPDSVNALYRNAVLAQELGDEAEANQLFGRVLESSPDFVPALNNRAVLAARLDGDLGKALELARKARALAPQSGAVADTLGWIHFQRGEFGEAATLIEEAAEAFPGEPEVAYHLGMVRYRNGDVAGARAALERALEGERQFFGREDAERRLALLDGAGGADAAASVAEIETMLEATPDDPVLLLRLADAVKAEDPQRAASLFRKVLASNAKSVPALTGLALLLDGPLGEREEARALAEEARAAAPNDAFAAAVLGFVARDGDDPRWAYGLLGEGLALEAGDLRFLEARAQLAYRLGRVVEARETMERFLEAAAGEGIGPAKAFLAMTDPEAKAADRATAAAAVLRDRPDDVPALVASGVGASAEGDLATARARLEKALGLWPGSPVVQRELAILLASSPPDRDEAYELAVAARGALPDDVELARTLGRLGHHRGDHAYAVQLLAQSDAEEALDPLSRYLLGRSQLELGEEEEGLKSLQKAIADGLDGPEAIEAGKLLEESKAEGGETPEAAP